MRTDIPIRENWIKKEEEQGIERKVAKNRSNERNMAQYFTEFQSSQKRLSDVKMVTIKNGSMVSGKKIKWQMEKNCHYLIVSKNTYLH